VAHDGLKSAEVQRRITVDASQRPVLRCLQPLQLAIGRRPTTARVDVVVFRAEGHRHLLNGTVAVFLYKLYMFACYSHRRTDTAA